MRRRKTLKKYKINKKQSKKLWSKKNLILQIRGKENGKSEKWEKRQKILKRMKMEGKN